MKTMTIPNYRINRFDLVGEGLEVFYCRHDAAFPHTYQSLIIPDYVIERYAIENNQYIIDNFYIEISYSEAIFNTEKYIDSIIHADVVESILLFFFSLNN